MFCIAIKYIENIYSLLLFYYLYVKLLISNCAMYLPIVSEIQFKYPTPIENLNDSKCTLSSLSVSI